MTARTFGDLAAGVANANRPAGAKKLRRTNAPVRRHSYHAGERERQVWRPVADGKSRGARRYIGAVMQAAERYDRKHKAAGRRNGALGHIGLEVLRELYRLVDYKTGALYPAIETIAGNIRRSRAAVVAALARLKLHGFLQWIRRTEPTGNDGEFGPQVRQISNAYGFDPAQLPKFAADLVRRLIGAAPPPEDAVAREAEHAAETRAMLQGLSATAYVDVAGPEDPELAEALRAYGASLSNANSPTGQNPASEESNG